MWRNASKSAIPRTLRKVRTMIVGPAEGHNWPQVRLTWSSRRAETRQQVVGVRVHLAARQHVVASGGGGGG